MQGFPRFFSVSHGVHEAHGSSSHKECACDPTAVCTYTCALCSHPCSGAIRITGLSPPPRAYKMGPPGYHSPHGPPSAEVSFSGPPPGYMLSIPLGIVLSFDGVLCTAPSCSAVMHRIWRRDILFAVHTCRVRRCVVGEGGVKHRFVWFVEYGRVVAHRTVLSGWV